VALLYCIHEGSLAVLTEERKEETTVEMRRDDNR
jgi:hypothetical protein